MSVFSRASGAAGGYSSCFPPFSSTAIIVPSLSPFGLFAFGNSHDGGYRIACAEVDDLHPLGSPSGQPDVGGSGTYRRSVAGDYHQVVFVGYRLDGDHLAGLLGHLHRLDALAAPVGRAVGIQIGAFAVTVLAEYEDVVGAFRFHAYHSYYAVVAFDGDGAYGYYIRKYGRENE